MVRVNYRSIMQNHIFTNTEQKYMMLLPFAIRTRPEPPQNCYIAQIPGHTNYAQSVRQPFLSNTALRFSHEMTVATIGPFQILHSLRVIDMNFMILWHFLLKLWRDEILL
jgi:hypothetical protein